MDLSIILLVHDEGLLSHKTLLSIFEALNNCKQYSFEIITVLNYADDATRSYFQRYKDDKRFRIVESSFDNQGELKNYAIDKAAGEFIFLLKAGDLISYNTINVAMEKAHSDPHSLFHPEFILSFGVENWLIACSDSKSVEESSFQLLATNPWPASVFGRRDIFKKVPFIECPKGIYYDDWIFNSSTVANGFLHKILNGCILFLRRDGDWTSPSRARTLLPKYISVYDKYSAFLYSPIFEIKKFSKYDTIINETSSNEDMSSFVNFYSKARNIKAINSIISPLATFVKNKTGIKLVKSPCHRYFTPEFIDKWESINKIENELFPFARAMEKRGLYRFPLSIAYCFAQLARCVKEYPDIVFVAQFVSAGGAEKVLLNYVSALSSIYKNINITIITTVKSENNWKDRLPDNVSLLEFGNMIDSLEEYEKDILFGRLISQLNCQRIHIVNSIFAYEWVRKHMDYACNYLYLTVSYFFYGLMESTDFKAKTSYADPYLISIYPAIRKIYTDNSVIVKSSALSEGFEERKFKIHYQPVEVKKITSRTKAKYAKNKVNILWAGRICSAKNPTLLIEIAKQLKRGFHIDVYGRFDEGLNINIFKGVQNITYKGAFSSFYEIETSKYDMLLYTSRSDGVPNIILEAASCELPIIASCVGGIPDIINEDTGILISDHLNPVEYVKAIYMLGENPKLATRLAGGAKEILVERHSWKNFKKIVKNDFEIKLRSEKISDRLL